MILGSHNSWSYLPVKKWYLKSLAFTAKCQSIDIKTQYEKYGVRCFDLRIKFNNKDVTLCHGLIEYKYSFNDIISDLEYLNNKKDCYVRVIHEIRTKKQYINNTKINFALFCLHIVEAFPNIKFWCGRNLYNWEIDYNFNYNPSCEENYASVKSPKFIDDWFPLLYAKCKNKNIIKQGTDKDILLIDFVNINYK